MKKYLLYVGVLCVFGVSAFMSRAARHVAFNYIEKAALVKLETVEHIKDRAIYLPEMEVAGPKGGLVTIPDKDHFMLIALWSVKYKPSIENLEVLRHVGSILSGYGEDKDWRVVGISIDDVDVIDNVARVLKIYDLRDVGGYYDVHRVALKTIAPEVLPVTLIVDDHGRLLYKVYGNALWVDPDVIAFLRSLQQVKIE